MTNQAGLLLPQDLMGPRSYFTDLDPLDMSMNMASVERNLKLQLLTKKKIVFGASNLYHQIGHQLFSRSTGLTNALNQGIILPAIRAEFESPMGFFEAKSSYPLTSRKYFVENTSSYVAWTLSDNTRWFQQAFYKALRDPASPLRQGISLTDSSAEVIIEACKLHISNMEQHVQHLSRDIIHKALFKFEPHTAVAVQEYANLIYRMSGARAVNSEGHFPQCNLVSGEISEPESSLSESSIFWDIYVEAVLQHVTSATRITSDRIDRLTFEQILEIRSDFFEKEFSELYDELVEKAKLSVVGKQPEHIVLRAEQLHESAEKLRILFDERLRKESGIQSRGKQENALWQVANVIAIFSTPVVGCVMGMLSALKSLPEITAPTSNRLTKSIESRSNILRILVNEQIGWSDPDRKTFIDAYRSLLIYGI